MPVERIERRILLRRGEKVILDSDLAGLYEVPTKTLNQAVRRNRDRFPADFMFQLTWEEARQLLRSQSVTLEGGHHLKYRPYAFTEHGVAMLSSVLRSERAVQVNIAIVRAFVRLRKLLAEHKGLARKIEEMERKSDGNFRVVFEAIRTLMAPSVREARRVRIGFRVPKKGPQASRGTPGSRPAEDRTIGGA